MLGLRRCSCLSIAACLAVLVHVHVRVGRVDARISSGHAKQSKTTAAAAAPDTPYLEVVSHRYPAATLFDSVGAVYQAVAVKRGFFVLASRGLFYGKNMCNATPDMAPRGLKLDAVGLPSVVRETLTGNADASRLVLTGHSGSLALVTPSAVFVLNCTSDMCVTHASTVVHVGKVTSAAADPGTDSVWVCSSRGLFRWQPQQGVQHLLNQSAIASVSVARRRAAVATRRRLYQYDLKTTQLLRWDWITDVVTGQGGVIDDQPTALSYAPDGTLWIGTASCLNVLYDDDTVSRFAGKDGLPMSNHTAIDASTWLLPHPIAADLEIDSSRELEYPRFGALWIGTQMGLAVARWDLDAQCDPAYHPRCSETFRWQYLNGPRWLTGYSVRSIAVLDAAAGVVVVTEGGISILEHQVWTLQQKAAHYETMIPRHDRHGLVAGCALKKAGDTSSIECHDDDNNGLWTSLIVAAEAFRFAVTRDSEAEDRSRHFLGGLQQLWDVTGVPGLMARSLVAPGEAHGAGTWWNSSTMKGWIWKGDTSSDEVTGHAFGWSVATQLIDSRNTARQHEMRGRLRSLARHIIMHNYTLRDVDGRVTTWGRWQPAALNADFALSDDRGNNALEVLGYIAAGLTAAAGSLNGSVDDFGPTPSSDIRLFREAYDFLASDQNQYIENCVNQLIIAPCDENSGGDIQLGFLAYYTFITAAWSLNSTGHPAGQQLSSGLGSILMSLRRTWLHVRSQRSSFWTAFYLSLAKLPAADERAVGDLQWNLRTWPLELVDFAINNSQRIDLRYDREADRFGELLTTRVLPANERRQSVYGRWDNMPTESVDGGDGRWENSPGDWLLPYWMARYYGILA